MDNSKQYGQLVPERPQTLQLTTDENKLCGETVCIPELNTVSGSICETKLGANDAYAERSSELFSAVVKRDGKRRQHNAMELAIKYENTFGLTSFERELLPLLRVFRGCDKAVLPLRSTPGSAGMDLTM